MKPRKKLIVGNISIFIYVNIADQIIYRDIKKSMVNHVKNLDRKTTMRERESIEDQPQTWQTHGLDENQSKEKGLLR